VRIVYLGTPVDAVKPLRALVADGVDVALVVTQPDRRRTRGAGAEASPVKQAALDLGLPVVTPEKAREVVDDVRASAADLGVVVAFGQLLPVSLLEALPHGFVNIHFSVLPRWRGAAPVERAILAGDLETGVDLMRIEAGLDTGPVFARTRVPIGANETAGELHLRLVDAGTELLRAHLPTLANAIPEPQQGEPTYAEKLGVDEFRLDPARPAVELARIVRAGNPRPGAWLRAGGRRVKVWRAHEAPVTDPGGTDPGGTDPGGTDPGGSDPGGTDPAAPLERGAIGPDGALATVQGVLVLDEVQPEGKRVMDAAAWRAGTRGDLRADPE
jgi:methionyl-tRNA formyltransferase